LRGVATAIALSADTAVLCLHSPFDCNAVPASSIVSQLIEGATSKVVLISSQHPRDAVALGATVHLFYRGARVRVFENTTAPILGTNVAAHLPGHTLSVMTQDKHSLLLQLVNQSNVQVTSLPGGLALSGATLEELSHALWDAVRASGARVTAIDCGAPNLAALRTAIAGQAQGLYKS
jgi:hypothetical protein